MSRSASDPARPSRPRVLIVGGGTAGWMTAAALARFACDSHEIVLVESEAIGTVGVGEATIPGIRQFNAALGIDERAFLAATNGTYKAGIEFVGWTGAGSAYIHAFGPIGRPLGLMPYHQHWAAEALAGNATELWAASATARAAAQGRFAPVEHPTLAWAYHFDAGAYARFLRAYAEARGVVRYEGRIARVERDGEGGHVIALHLDDGRALAGDWFVDCSGFRSLLLGETLGVPFVDWSRWLPCDRALAVPSARLPDLPPFTRATADEGGWRWRIPLTHRTGNGHVYCSAALSDDQATAQVLAGLDGAALADPRPLRFTAGMRARQWEGNVVAIGLSGGFLEPLESTSIHLIQSGIERLLRFLPAHRPHPVAVAKFNEAAATEYERIRDFIILHYKASDRPGDFWQGLRAMPVPDGLAAKLALFKAGATLIREDEELFTEVGWLQVLTGQGIAPRACHPIAAATPSTTRRELIALASRQAAEVAARLPFHRDLFLPETV